MNFKIIVFYSSLFICGCNTSSDNSTSINKIGISINKIDISSNVSFVQPNGPHVRYYAKGHYSNGDIKDITTLVNWSSSQESLALIERSGLITALKEGEVTIKANLNNIQSNEDKLIIGSSFSCDDNTGHQDNNSSCLKVYEDNYGNIFSGTPNIETTRKMLLKIGHDYSDTYVENGKFGPHQTEYPLFSSDQQKRWCSLLNTFSFKNRSNWQVPTVAELISLHHESGNLWINYAWPATKTYKTADHFTSFDIFYGGKYSTLPTQNLYSACVSKE